MVTTTNWSDLPIEMMSQVKKHLDFKSRMLMRRTARLEKAIVEATKMHIQYVDVSGPDVSAGGLDWNTEQEIGKFEGEEEKLISLSISLMRETKIEQFQLSSIDYLEDVTEGVGKFNFPVFGIDHFPDNDFQRAFELSEPGIKTLHLLRPPKLGLERVFRDPLTLPVVLGASYLSNRGSLQPNQFDQCDNEYMDQE